MAVTETRTLPPFYVQKLGEDFASYFTGAPDPETGELTKPITDSPFYVDPSKFTGEDFVAEQDQFTKDAQALAGGLGDYKSYLDRAQGFADVAGDMVVDPVTGQVRPAAGADTLAKAGTAYDDMQAAAAAGQDASSPFMQAAQGFTGADAYKQFMSPYQQEVIDATMAQLQKDAARKQSQLGASAGSAFGGGRFGAAQGALAAQNILDQALTGAQLRAQGFTQANQLANQAFQQQMGLGTQAMQQAGQNVGLFGQAGQAQANLAGQQNQQFANQLAQLGGLAAQQQGLGQYQTSMLGNQINALTQMGQQNQAYQQALLDARKTGLREQAFAGQQGLGFLNQMLGGVLGAPGGTTFQTTPDPSTAQTLLGGGIGLLGILGATGAFDPRRSN